MKRTSRVAIFSHRYRQSPTDAQQSSIFHEPTTSPFEVVSRQIGGFTVVP